MIDIFHAQHLLQQQMASAPDERSMIRMVMAALDSYALATSVKHAELDIAFAATGGPTQWVNVDNMAVDFSPQPERASQYGDILVERAYGYVNLSTPAGFIPLVDVIAELGILKRKQLN
ncbi:hypothetical protein LJ739_15915 [Aestuariibacter halophilus]|uniref:Uncharacterized protein n=1 Tax=Fluctibacter halophilus TaxID=226011 RepID=A0ABS8GD73_9ALTE|nr:hypothetical protein [Aestuariibacter halophilus]MCC2617739.1 hypothetical protein [Aestuariibacter halophilus]